MKVLKKLYFVFGDIVECDWASQHDPHMADTAGSRLLHPTDSELKCRHQKTQENFIFCTLYFVFHIFWNWGILAASFA